MKLLLILIGWSGTSIIIVAYLLNVLQIISPDDVIFPMMNLIGAVFLAIEYIRKKAYPGIALEAVWGIIALINFVTIFR